MRPVVVATTPAATAATTTNITTTSTLGLRIASVFIVTLVSFFGCAVAVFLSSTTSSNKGSGRSGGEGPAPAAADGGSAHGDRSITNRLLKCTAAGVVACVGFVHILPDSAEMLSRVTDYPLAYVVAMSGAFLLLATNQVLDYVFTFISTTSTSTSGSDGSSYHHHSYHTVDGGGDGEVTTTTTTPFDVESDDRSHTQYHAYQHDHQDPHHHHHASHRQMSSHDDHHHHQQHHHHHCHHEAAAIIYGFKRQPLILAYIMEFGIIFHSVIIGVGLGVLTDSMKSVRSLLVAICFHQFFEGAGLSACIVDANLGHVKTAIMIGMFSITTSIGIVVGIAISGAYDPNSLTSCLVQGVVNALASGILIYLTLVDMVAEEFGHREVKADIVLQLKMFCALLLGAAIMSVIAIWA